MAKDISKERTKELALEITKEMDAIEHTPVHAVHRGHPPPLAPLSPALLCVPGLGRARPGVNMCVLPKDSGQTKVPTAARSGV